ncbi:unnamed protein product [Mytilus edulis]|uniref:Uncharacterized protein n=1 Tax=Mytilus edulis TaxID=6550 RepID=A0A8S3U232_MYTED|nr:unnamed protein product [Mytilus edulis]
MSKKSFDPYKFRKQNKIQTGLGLYERFRGSYLIPVNPNSTQTESTLIQNKQVAPVEADAERAESELKENNKERPISNLINESTPIEMVISGAGNDYIDLRKSRLCVKMQILKADGSHLVAHRYNQPTTTENVFSCGDVYMNNKLVSVNDNNYPWKAYLKTILSSGNDEQNSQLQSQLFMKDDDPRNPLSLNSGYVSRYEYTKESRIFELEGNLLEDSLVGQIFDKWSRYILKIIPVFHTIPVDVWCKPDPGVIINHRNLFREHPAKYLINRSHVTQNVIQKGVTEFYRDSIFPKELPDKVVFGILPQKALNGDYTINPFDFKHFNMESVSLKVNGVDVYGSPMKLDFGTNRNYTAAYVKLFEICEKWNKDTGLNISL